jgi:hypothetical protein
MILKYSKIFSILILLANPDAHASKVISDEDLLNISIESIERRKNASNEQTMVTAMRDGMVGLTDSQRTRSLALWLFHVEATDPQWRMRPETGDAVRIILLKDPSLIIDASEVKKILASEVDPRKFYLLFSIAGPVMSAHKVDLIPDISHMLSSSQPLALMNGEYYHDSLTNASYFTYNMIVKNLSLLGSEFQEPDQTLSYESRIRILAQWLKEKWPGCEGIEIPSQFSDDRPRKTLGENDKTPSRTTDGRGKETPQGAGPQNIENRLPWIIAGCLLVGVIALLFNRFKG